MHLLLALVLVLSFQPCFARGSVHSSSHSCAHHSPGVHHGINHGCTHHSNSFNPTRTIYRPYYGYYGRPYYYHYYERLTHLIVLITPSYRREQIAKANKSLEKRIQAIENKIEVAKQKNKNTDKLSKLLTLEKSKLIEPAAWDKSDFPEFIVVPLGQGFDIFKQPEIKDFYIANKNGELMCKPKSQNFITISKSDKTYLEKVYHADLHRKHHSIMVTTYDPQCLVQPLVTSKVYILNSNSFTKTKITKQVDLNFSEKQTIKQDFGVN